MLLQIIKILIKILIRTESDCDGFVKIRELHLIAAFLRTLLSNQRSINLTDTQYYAKYRDFLKIRNIAIYGI